MQVGGPGECGGGVEREREREREEERERKRGRERESQIGGRREKRKGEKRGREIEEGGGEGMLNKMVRKAVATVDRSSRI
jgi:hypothetical protein